MCAETAPFLCILFLHPAHAGRGLRRKMNRAAASAKRQLAAVRSTVVPQMANCDASDAESGSSPATTTLFRIVIDLAGRYLAGDVNIFSYGSLYLRYTKL